MIQLPQSNFKIEKEWGNIPLAAGCLKAAAWAAGLLDDVDITIADGNLCNLSCDSAIIDHVTSLSPDMLCWSLYVWNTRRCLYLSTEIKKNVLT